MSRGTLVEVSGDSPCDGHTTTTWLAGHYRTGKVCVTPHVQVSHSLCVTVCFWPRLYVLSVEYPFYMFCITSVT